MDKYRHRLCLVSVGLALFNQADKGIGNRIQNTEDRIQESVAQGPYLLSPVFCILSMTAPTPAVPVPVEMPMPVDLGAYLGAK